MNKRSGKESRKKILHAAMKVFSKKGYAGANIRSISEASGISVGALYLYFRNKEDLYLSILAEKIDEMNRMAESLVSSEKPPLAALSEFADFHLDYARKHKKLIFIHIRELGLEFAKDIKKQFFKKQVSLLENIIREGIRKGQFRACDALETAKVIMVMLRGAVLSIAMESEQYSDVSELKEIILYGIVRNVQREKSRTAKKGVKT